MHDLTLRLAKLNHDVNNLEVTDTTTLHDIFTYIAFAFPVLNFIALNFTLLNFAPQFSHSQIPTLHIPFTLPLFIRFPIYTRSLSYFGTFCLVLLA